MEIYQIYLLIGLGIGGIYSSNYTVKYMKLKYPDLDRKGRFKHSGEFFTVYMLSGVISTLLWPMVIVDIVYNFFKRGTKKNGRLDK